MASRHWRTKLAQAEPRIVQMIELARGNPAVLEEWDHMRGHHWAQSEADARWIMLECVPILERHAAKQTKGPGEAGRS